MSSSSQKTEPQAPDQQGAGPNALPRLWTPIFVLIIACTLCSFMMSMTLNTGTTVYLAEAGYGTALAGILAMVFSYAAAAARLVAGVIVDSGRCSLSFTIGLATCMVGSLLSAVPDSIPILTVARILQGIGFSLGTTSLSAAAADVLPKERLGEGIGYAGLGQAFAMSMGPALGLFLVGTDPSSNLFFGVALIGVLGLILAFNARYERKVDTLPPTSAYATRYRLGMTGGKARAAAKADKPKGLKGMVDLLEPRALPGAIPMGILCPLFGFGIFFVGAYGASFGYGGAGLFFTVSAIMMILVRISSKSFMDRVPALYLFAVATASGVICTVILLFGGVSQQLFILGGVFYGICMGLGLPVNQAVMSKNTPSERWGAANALFWLVYDVIIGIFCVALGYLNDIFGYHASLYLVIVLIVLSFVSACIVYPEDQKRWTKK